MNASVTQHSLATHLASSSTLFAYFASSTFDLWACPVPTSFRVLLVRDCSIQPTSTRPVAIPFYISRLVGVCFIEIRADKPCPRICFRWQDALLLPFRPHPLSSINHRFTVWPNLTTSFEASSAIASSTLACSTAFPNSLVIYTAYHQLRFGGLLLSDF